MSDFKRCGHCQMTVRKAAIVCGHCGARFVKYRDTSVTGRVLGAIVGGIIGGIGGVMVSGNVLGVIGAIVVGIIGFFVGFPEEKTVR